MLVHTVRDDGRVITDAAWKDAHEHLTDYIKKYQDIGMVGRLGLMLTLWPLDARYLKGERTEELYDEMMAVE